MHGLFSERFLQLVKDATQFARQSGAGIDAQRLGYAVVRLGNAARYGGNRVAVAAETDGCTHRVLETIRFEERFQRGRNAVAARGAEPVRRAQSVDREVERTVMRFDIPAQFRLVRAAAREEDTGNPSLNNNWFFNLSTLKGLTFWLGLFIINLYI